MAASSLLLDELFQAGDERFVREVVGLEDAAKLKGLARRWYEDPRPFARKALLQYLGDAGADRPNHRPLVKALLKAAEAKGDDEVMGALMVAFDGFTHRRLVTRWGWDPSARTSTQEEVLAGARGILSRLPKDLKKVPSWRRWIYDNNRRFSRVTRRYLQRRAWRYFRRLAHRDPARYRKALCAALARYPEEKLATPVQLLDAWSLLNALYRHSPVLRFPPAGADVVKGKSLEALAPAPYRRDAWKDAFDELLGLFLFARSNTVRAWALAFIRAEHAPKLEQVPLDTVRRLLRHARSDAQELGAELLGKVQGLGTLPVAEWLELLAIEHQAAVLRVVDLVKQYVTPDRLTLPQCVALAGAKVAAVAELGLSWARGRGIATEADLEALLPLTRAGVASVRRAGAAWIAELLAKDERASAVERVRDLLDSNHAEVRDEAMKLMASHPRFGEATPLWAAMAESPWPDAREALVSTLTAREKAFEPQTLQAVWATSLLAIRRGGRVKVAVAGQVADRVVRRPEEAKDLLPLLGLALRSVRPAERRTALAALTRAAARAPEVAKALTAALPELTLHEQEAWA